MGTPDPDPGSLPVHHAAAPPPLAVDIVRRACVWEDVADDILVRAARAAFAAARLDAPPSEVSLLLTGDEEVSALNKSWRDKDGPTNVLSFSLDTPQSAAGPRPLGDVVLAYETVVREAADRGIATGQHAVHLVVHGMLHLMGYDHISDQEAAIMEGLEVRILAALGLPDPYSLQSAIHGERQ